MLLSVLMGTTINGLAMIMSSGNMFGLQNLFLRISSILIEASCTTTKDTSLNYPPLQEKGRIDEHVAKFELLDLLRNQQRLQIRGSGNYNKILVRGHKSIQGDNDPLNVLDGVVLGRTYLDVANAVDVTHVEHVITNTSSTCRKIRLKRS